MVCAPIVLPLATDSRPTGLAVRWGNQIRHMLITVLAGAAEVTAAQRIDAADGCNHAQMRPEIYTVAGDGPGRISIMARPRGGEELASEIYALRDAGVDTLVCALSSAEIR